MKPHKTKLSPNFDFNFVKGSNWSDLALMFYKSRFNLRHSEKGTALVAVMGFGLLLILLGSIAIARSGKENVNAASNAATEQSLAITDGGINQVVSAFRQQGNRTLLLLNKDKWNDPTRLNTQDNNVVLPANLCDANSDGSYNVTDYVSSNNTTMPGDNSPLGTSGTDSAGQFSIINYTFSGNPTSSGIGTLEVQGKLNKHNQSSNNIGTKSQIRVQFPITISRPPGTSFAAGIIAEDISIGKLDAYANTVICTDPQKCPLGSGGGCTSGTDKVLDYTTSTDVTNFQSALNIITSGGSNLGSVLTPNPTTPITVEDNSNIQIFRTTIPPIPQTTQLANIHNINTHDVIKNNGDGITGTVDDNGINDQLNSDIFIIPTNYSFVLEDVDGDGTQEKIWYFQVNDWNKGMINVNIGLMGAKDQVRIYVADTSLNLTGNDGIRAYSDTTTPYNNLPGGFKSGDVVPINGQIRLLGGYAAAGVPVTKQTWSLGGTVCITAQVHAPSAELTVSNGTGCSGIALNASPYNVAGTKTNDRPNIYGSIWTATVGIIDGAADNDNAGIFYEDQSLTAQLLAEYQNSFPQVAGAPIPVMGLFSSKQRLEVTP